MGGGRTKQGDDAVAHHLVDHPTERRDVAGQQLETAVDHTLDVLGIAMLGQCGEPNDVGEQGRDDTTLIATGLNRSAVRAETGTFGHGRSAATTCH